MKKDTGKRPIALLDDERRKKGVCLCCGNKKPVKGYDNCADCDRLQRDLDRLIRGGL